MIRGGLHVVNCEFGMIFMWIVHEGLDMCVVTNLAWGTLMVGNPVVWYWYGRRHFTHGW